MKRITAGRARRRSITRRLALAVVVATFVVPACGKKGPPRPPLVRLPARPEAFAARRLGSVAYLQFQVPAANADGTTPADIQRVDVYGFTGQPPAREDLFKYGTVVASVPVRKPAEEAPAPQEKGKGRGTRRGRAEAAGGPRPGPRLRRDRLASLQNGFDQGDMVVVTEPIGQAQLRTSDPAETGSGGRSGPGAAVAPTRFYVAVGVNHKGQKGAVSGRQAGRARRRRPAGAVRRWPRRPTPQTASTPSGRPGGPRTAAFNVYEVPAGRPPPEGVKIPTPPAAAGQLPVPVNATPVPGPAFVDSRIAFGKPRCYIVRAVTLSGAQAIESEASPAGCVTPIDTFPPAAPSVAERHRQRGRDQPDLGGRTASRTSPVTSCCGEPCRRDFRPVTPPPIAETLRDASVGRRALRLRRAGRRRVRQPERSIEPGRGSGEIASSGLTVTRSAKRTAGPS